MLSPQPDGQGRQHMLLALARHASQELLSVSGPLQWERLEKRALERLVGNVLEETLRQGDTDTDTADFAKYLDSAQNMEYVEQVTKDIAVGWGYCRGRYSTRSKSWRERGTKGRGPTRDNTRS